MISKKLDEINYKLNTDNDISKVLEGAIYNKDLTNVVEFVEKVIVYDKENIEIKFNFKNNFKNKV